MMPSANKVNPTLCRCAARQCIGHNFPHGATCKMIHDLDITKWPNTTFTKWAALIDQMPALDWNRKVIDPAKVTPVLPNLPHPPFLE